jgi:hypothetical protein
VTSPTPAPVPVGQVQRLAEAVSEVEEFVESGGYHGDGQGGLDTIIATLRRQDEVLHHAANLGCCMPYVESDCLRQTRVTDLWCASCAALACLFGQAGDIDKKEASDGS